MPRRQTCWGQLMLALAIAPIVTGMIGGALITLGLAPGMHELHLEARGGVRDGFIASALLVGFVAGVIGVIYSYVLGLPLMLASWLTGHAFSRRTPLEMAAALGLAGGVFAHIVFNLGFGLPPQLMQHGHFPDIHAAGYAGAGVIAGAGAGLLVGAMGYRPAKPEASA